MNEGKSVFHFQPAQMGCHRWTCEHFEVDELIGPCDDDFRLPERFALHSLRAERRHARVELSSLRTGDMKLFGHSTEIDDLNNDRRVTALLQHGLAWTAPCFDARFRIQFHDEQHVVIEHLLQALGLLLPRGVRERLLCFRRQRCAQEIECLHQPRHVCRQRLRGHRNHFLRLRRTAVRDQQWSDSGREQRREEDGVPFHVTRV